MPSRNTLLWTAVLFVFWVLLSGRLDAAHLGLGAVCAAAVAAVTGPLLRLPPAIGPAATEPLTAALAARFLWFLLWILGQIVAGSIQVAWVVLHPRLPVRPRLLRFRSDLPHPLARLTLANAITVTPGTVTLDVDGGDFLVHSLTDKSARGLGDGASDGDMQRRVRAVFVPAGRRAR